MSKASPESARAALERRALFAARSLVDRVRRLYRDLEQLTGAPIAAHRLLACLGEQQGLTSSQLAEALGMQRPALSQVLKGLVERGWVERVRSASDQRSVRVYLTGTGRQVLAATAGRAVGTLQRAVRRLSKSDLEGLAAGIEKVLSGLPEPPPSEQVRNRQHRGVRSPAKRPTNVRISRAWNAAKHRDARPSR